MKVTTEVNGILVEINATRMLNLAGLTEFMQSLTSASQPEAQAPVVVKRGRGRPPGARNKLKKGVRK